MSDDLQLRDMHDSERNMVLSDWKQDLRDQHPLWGMALHSEEWWALVNHVIDTITLPSCNVIVAVHRNEPLVPLAWAAQRDGSCVHLHGSGSVLKDPELAAFVERALRSTAPIPSPTFNPFLEMKRARSARGPSGDPCPS